MLDDMVPQKNLVNQSNPQIRKSQTKGLQIIGVEGNEMAKLINDFERKSEFHMSASSREVLKLTEFTHGNESIIVEESRPLFVEVPKKDGEMESFINSHENENGDETEITPVFRKDKLVLIDVKTNDAMMGFGVG